LKAQGTTIFLNSHILQGVDLICDRVAILDRGRLVASGVTRELLRAGETLEDAFVRLVAR
jgi:ABC-2 type transport system ATP-binding protein